MSGGDPHPGGPGRRAGRVEPAHVPRGVQQRRAGGGVDVGPRVERPLAGHAGREPVGGVVRCALQQHPVVRPALRHGRERVGLRDVVNQLAVLPHPQAQRDVGTPQHAAVVVGPVGGRQREAVLPVLHGRDVRDRGCEHTRSEPLPDAPRLAPDVRLGLGEHHAHAVLLDLGPEVPPARQRRQVLGAPRAHGDRLREAAGDDGARLPVHALGQVRVADRGAVGGVDRDRRAAVAPQRRHFDALAVVREVVAVGGRLVPRGGRQQRGLDDGVVVAVGRRRHGGEREVRLRPVLHVDAGGDPLQRVLGLQREAQARQVGRPLRRGGDLLRRGPVEQHLGVGGGVDLPAAQEQGVGDRAVVVEGLDERHGTVDARDDTRPGDAVLEEEIGGVGLAGVRVQADRGTPGVGADGLAVAVDGTNGQVHVLALLGPADGCAHLSAVRPGGHDVAADRAELAGAVGRGHVDLDGPARRDDDGVGRQRERTGQGAAGDIGDVGRQGERDVVGTRVRVRQGAGRRLAVVRPGERAHRQGCRGRGDLLREGAGDGDAARALGPDVHARGLGRGHQRGLEGLAVQVGPGLLEHRGRARDVRGGHGGAAQRGVQVVDRVARGGTRSPRGDDPVAGRHHVRLEHPRLDAAAAGVPGDGVVVVHGAHREGGRRDARRAHGAVPEVTIVARGHDEERAELGGQLVHRDGVGRGDVEEQAAQGQVHHVGALRGRPLHALDDAGQLAEAVVVQHLADQQVGVRGHALVHAVGRIARPGQDRGDVRAVAGAVGRLALAGEVPLADDDLVEVGVGRVDARVEHRDRHARTRVAGLPGLRGADLRHRAGVRGPDGLVQPDVADGVGLRGLPGLLARGLDRGEGVEELLGAAPGKDVGDCAQGLEVAVGGDARRRPVLLERGCGAGGVVLRAGVLGAGGCGRRLDDHGERVARGVVVAGLDQAGHVEQRAVQAAGYEPRHVARDHVEVVSLPLLEERHVLPARAGPHGHRPRVRRAVGRGLQGDDVARQQRHAHGAARGGGALPGVLWCRCFLRYGRGGPRPPTQRDRQSDRRCTCSLAHRVLPSESSTPPVRRHVSQTHVDLRGVA